jgi:hypothetical protein
MRVRRNWGSDIPDAAIEMYTCGLDAYLAAEWRKAMRHFEETLSARTDDWAAAVMIERCRRPLAPPPAQWDGVADLD